MVAVMGNEAQMSLRGVPARRGDEAISTFRTLKIATACFTGLAMTTPKISFDRVLAFGEGWLDYDERHGAALGGLAHKIAQILP